MMIDLTIDELEMIHSSLDDRKGRFLSPPGLCALIKKIENVTVAAKVAEGQRFIRQQGGQP